MTPPEEFHEMVTQTLVHFNGILPKGSHVVLLGLIHGNFFCSFLFLFLKVTSIHLILLNESIGELMWDSMFDKQHFIGATYGALWVFYKLLINFKINNN